MIFALAGRRIDAPDASTPRFPAQNIPVVRQKILALFKEHQPQALICSAACGADLLALQVAEELNIHREIVLPFPPAIFRQFSVADRPGDWGAIFDQIVADLEPLHQIIQLNLNSEAGEGAYLTANWAILDRAQSLAREKNQPLSAILVWNGSSRPNQDVTLAFLHSAQSAHLPILQIPTL